ncbi:MAG: hypothetical protein LIP01_08925 [Tannerellaceae bacterium]|nr:hypothetical protein [Tannerellaceae bacterium]
MTTKIDLATEIYKVRNLLKEIKGEPTVEITNEHVQRQINEDTRKYTKDDLRLQLERLNELIEPTKHQVEIKRKTDEYYQTEEGKRRKELNEFGLSIKREEWISYEKEVTQTFEHYIQLVLGENWGVSCFHKNTVTFSVIDKDKSTPEKREYLFGQDIPVRTDEKWNSNKSSSLTYSVNICSCGDSNIEKGNQYGDRAYFYVGLGKFLDNPVLIQNVIKLLEDSSVRISQFEKEYEEYQNKIIDPLGLKKEQI